MGVAEQRQPLRMQRSGEFRAAGGVARGLLGQAVHQIEIEVFDAGLAQPVGGALDQFERLHPADGVLHMRAGILHAEAGAVDADGFERAHQRLVEPARIEFDGVFLQAAEIEARGQLAGDRLQPFRPEDRRRAAAPMQMREPARR